jgi:hypothetical protein
MGEFSRNQPANAQGLGGTGTGRFGFGPGRWHAPAGTFWTDPANQALQQQYPNGGIFPNLPGGGTAPQTSGSEGLLNGQPRPQAPSPHQVETPAQRLARLQAQWDQQNQYTGISPAYRPGYVPPTPQEAAGGHHNTGGNAPSIDPAAPAGSNWGQPTWWPTRVQDSFDPLGGTGPRKAAPQRQRGPTGKA